MPEEPYTSADSMAKEQPRLRIMGEFSWVTNAGMTCRKTIIRDWEVHEFIHVLQNQHIGIQHNDSFELVKPVNMDLGPCLIEPRFGHGVGSNRAQSRNKQCRNRPLCKDIQRALTQGPRVRHLSRDFGELPRCRQRRRGALSLT